MDAHTAGPDYTRELECPDRHIHRRPPELDREHWPEPLLLEPRPSMADLDASLVQEVLSIPKRQREADVQHDCQADHH